MTHHIAFTIVRDLGHVVIKDEAHQVVRYEHVPLGEVSGELAAWLVCKAAIRLADQRWPNVVLYSDLAVIEQLVNLEMRAEDRPRYETHNGRPKGVDGLLGQHFDAAAMLWEKFRGQWTAHRVTQERILQAVER